MKFHSLRAMFIAIHTKKTAFKSGYPLQSYYSLHFVYFLERKILRQCMRETMFSEIFFSDNQTNQIDAVLIEIRSPWRELYSCEAVFLGNNSPKSYNAALSVIILV